jgi:hypothetical protein
MSSILKGSQILAFHLKVGSNPRRQSKNIEMNYISHIKLVNELHGTCFQSNTKIQPSTPLLVVTMPYVVVGISY